MTKLIFLFIVLLLAALLGITMHRHAGYVLINIAHTQIEMTLWVALFAILLLFFILQGFLQLMRTLIHLPDRYRGWSALHRERKSYQLSQTGVCELLQG